jgi:hypothetical protein
MAELIDKAELGPQLQAELFEGGHILLTATQDDPFLPTFIELEAKESQALFDFLRRKHERLIQVGKQYTDEEIRHAKALLETGSTEITD